MRQTAIAVSLTSLVVLAACRDTSSSPPTTIRALITSCTAVGEQDELIGGTLYSDPSITAGEYKVTIQPTGWVMYYATAGNPKSRWGALSAQNSDSPLQVEQHDGNADGIGDGGGLCEQHIAPNGVYTISFTRTNGGILPFSRTIAMLDRHGVAQNIPGSGVWQDVVVSFDLSSITVAMIGRFGASGTYVSIDPSGTQLPSFSTGPIPITSGDTAWFVSTYVAQANGGGTRPWFNSQQAVLNAFNFDYDRNAAAFGPATNSFPVTNNAFPFAHVFAAPGAATAFTVRLRTILPYHQQASDGIVVPQVLTVNVTGDPVTFSVSPNPTANQPVQFTAGALRGSRFFEYSWTFGDGGSSGWAAGNSHISHTYSTPGQKTVTLSVRNASGEGPTVSQPQNITVAAAPFTASWNEAPTPVRPKKICNWSVVASGGSGVYTYSWYVGGVSQGVNGPLLQRQGANAWFKWVVGDGATTLQDSIPVQVTTSAPADCVY